MWTTESCVSQLPETSQHSYNNEYDPPEKKQKLSENDASLVEALECCKNQELGIEEASIIYNIPKRTLRAKLKNDNFTVIDEKYRVFVLPVFPGKGESELAELLQDLITSQITFTSDEVRRLGYELVCEKYKVSNLPHEKNCLLGQRWYRRFITLYPHMAVEHSLLRVHKEKSTSFYNALENFVGTYGIDSSRIFSVDKVELKFRASGVDDLKIFHRRKTIYTDAKAICCTSPTGTYIPPVFLKLPGNPNLELDVRTNNLEEDEWVDGDENTDKSYLGTVCDKLKEMSNANVKNLSTWEDLASIQKQIKVHLNKKQQPMSEENEVELREKLYEQFSQLRNKIISKYESTLNEVTHEIFYDWFVTFINNVRPTPQKKVLLLLSDQSYIKCFRTLELAKANGVIFLVLPPHSIHKIYPLDGFTMSLNRNLSTCARCWLGKNPDFKVQQVPFHSLFKKAHSETINPIIAKNGFLYSGIWPINRNIFESSELGGESILLQKNSQFMLGSCLKATTILNRENVHSFLPGSKLDLEKLCRVCMKEKMYMKPLFELSSPIPNYHGKKISEIINVQISPDDGLPTSICQYCLVQLIDTIKIKTITIESHKKQLRLREVLDRFYFENEESAEKGFLSLFQYEMTQQDHSKIINRILSKNFDINSICRICMGEKPLMTSIFFKSQDKATFCPETSRKITEVSQYQVHVHDGLSSFICPFCRASINQSSEFVQRVLSSDKRFKEILTELRGKI